MSILSTSSLEFSTRDRFKMDHDKRGYLVIVDNHKFNKTLCTDLSGNEHDVEHLKHAFVNNLGFELVLKQNQQLNAATTVKQTNYGDEMRNR